MNRRIFLRNSIAGSLALLSTPAFNAFTLGGEAPASADLRSLLEVEDPQVTRLIRDIFRECVLGKLRPPEGTLKRTWITAGGGFYGQWIWDTMFVVDLLSILPGMERNIREIFQNYWDFQARWNAQMPAYAHDMVACMIEPKNNDWVKYPAYSQIPILAWGMERVYQRNGDKTLLQQGLAPLERFHEWYWRERDVTRVGLIAVGSYSGNIQHMWDENSGTFLSVQRDSLAQIPVATIGSWMGLAAGVPTEPMARRMAEALQTEHWTTPLPVPTVDRKDRRWKSDAYWRGDVWPAPNYQIATGLARYGYKDLAANLADRTIANAIKNGISEHYDAVSGKPLRVTFLGMSCTIATLMLDSLSGKYRARVKKASS